MVGTAQLVGLSALLLGALADDAHPVSPLKYAAITLYDAGGCSSPDFQYNRPAVLEENCCDRLGHHQSFSSFRIVRDKHWKKHAKDWENSSCKLHLYSDTECKSTPVLMSGNYPDNFGLCLSAEYKTKDALTDRARSWRLVCGEASKERPLTLTSTSTLSSIKPSTKTVTTSSVVSSKTVTKVVKTTTSVSKTIGTISKGRYTVTIPASPKTVTVSVLSAGTVTVVASPVLPTSLTTVTVSTAKPAATETTTLEEDIVHVHSTVTVWVKPTVSVRPKKSLWTSTFTVTGIAKRPEVPTSSATTS